MEPLRYPEAGDACEIDAGSITGLNCAGFGSSMVVTATFGMVAARPCCASWPRAANADGTGRRDDVAVLTTLSSEVALLS
jgi:hypothetical protein